MDTIIRKALDEALTSQYNAELTEREDEDYSFSVGFLSDMKNLIRKTDKKLIYYSKYIAAAACAVIAIGCAVLLPNLLRSDIKVDPSKTESATSIVTDITTDTTTVTTTPPGDEGANDSAGVMTTEITTDITTETTPDESVETTPEATTETTPEITTETSPVITDTTPADDEDDTVEDEESGDVNGDVVDIPDSDDVMEDDDAEIDGDVIEDADDEEDVVEDADDTDADVDVEADDDVDSEDDVITDDYEDDDVAVEDDEDDTAIEDDDCDDSDVEGDYIPPVDDDDANPGCGPGVDLVTVPGETVSEILGYYYRDDVTADVLDELYITHATRGTVYMNPEFIDTGFLMDYLKANKDAKRVENLSDYDTDHSGSVNIILSNAPKYMDRTFRDTSDRNNYAGIFGLEDVTEEDDADVEDDYMDVYVDIYPSGLISVQGMDICNETAFFVADKALTDALISELDSIEVTGNNYSTIGSLLKAFGLTGEGITQGYADIRGIYDITVTNAHIDTAKEKAKLAEILNKYENTKISWHDHRAPNYSEIKLKIDIGLRDSKTVLSIRATDEVIYFMGYIGEVWSAYFDEEGMKALINFVLSCENLPEADFYTNAYDYITERADFSRIKTAIHTDVDNGKIVEYVLNDEKLCEELRTMVLAGFKNAVYEPYNNTGMSRSIIISMGDWQFGISETGRIRLGACNFKASAEFYNKILAFIKENAVSASEEDMAVEEEDDVEVSIDWEDGDIAVDD